MPEFHIEICVGTCWKRKDEKQPCSNISYDICFGGMCIRCRRLKVSPWTTPPSFLAIPRIRPLKRSEPVACWKSVWKHLETFQKPFRGTFCALCVSLLRKYRYSLLGFKKRPQMPSATKHLGCQGQCYLSCAARQGRVSRFCIQDGIGIDRYSMVY